MASRPRPSTADDGKSLVVSHPLETLPLEPRLRASKQPRPVSGHSTRSKSTFQPHSHDFWAGFAAALLVDFFCAFQLTVVALILPTVVHHFGATDFIWPASAYAIASTAINPLCAGFAQAFGRKHVLLGLVATFAVGSAICGAADSIDLFIIGRVIQGIGGGGCACMTEIIYADLVPVAERGKYLAVQAAVWAIGVIVAPTIGGALAAVGAWRWVFFLNLPMCAIAGAAGWQYLHLPAPKQTLWRKLVQIDWIGNVLVLGSTTSVLVGLSWAGTRFAWNSIPVLLPVVLGAVGILLFFIVEPLWIKEPTFPRSIVADRSMLSGYLTTFLHGLTSMATIYYLPVYFQACKGATALQSGVDFLGISVTMPLFAIIGGASIGIFGRYRPQNYVGWMITIVGFGLLTTLDEGSSRAKYYGFEVVLGTGLGIIYLSAQFAITAPLETSRTAQAIALFMWTRSFAQSWGTVVGGAVLQNRVSAVLPPGFLNRFPRGAQLSYEVIPEIASLPEPLRTEVRRGFARSLVVVWYVMLGLSGLGLVACLMMREDSMSGEVDEQWAFQEREVDVEGRRSGAQGVVSGSVLPVVEHANGIEC